jgi:hypothetical protein
VRPTARFGLALPILPILPILAFLTLSARWAWPGPAASARAGTPRLLVVLVLDQMPSYQWDALIGELPPGGLRRLAGGRSLVGRYAHAITGTGPGHALIATGATAARSGIVSNEWWDRQSWRSVHCDEDPRYQEVGVAPQAHAPTSPLLLRASGVADSLSAATGGRSRVIALSWKGRAAILLGGFRPSAAVWFDWHQGRFTTSTYYGTALPAWAERANTEGRAARLVGTEWTPQVDAARLLRLGGRDDAPGEGDYHGLGTVFPHRIGSAAAIAATPLANQLLTTLALEAVAAEHLGRHDVPDLLLVSLSATDFVGHVFGPHSQEAVDTFFRLDRDVARLLAGLDRLVGTGRYTVVLTSDHGAPPVPEQVPGQGRPGVRLPPDEQLAARVEAGLGRAVGPGWQAAFVHPHLYLRGPAASLSRYPEALKAARAALLEVPGVERVLGAADLYALTADDAVGQAVARSWDPSRAGDLYVVLTPWSVFEEDMVIGKGTAHGSPRDYDQLVPLVWYGARVRGGRNRPAAPVPQEAVAATLAALLGVPAPPAAEAPALGDVLVDP